MKKYKLLFLYVFFAFACNKKDTTEENTELPGKVSFDYKLNGESLKHVTIINNKDFKKSLVEGDSDGWSASIYAKDQTMSISIGCLLYTSRCV